MRDLTADLQCLSINTATLRKQWRLDRIIGECARRGTMPSAFRPRVYA